MKLVWTEKAQRRIGEILEYIEREFGAKARQTFREKTQDFTRILIQFPIQLSLLQTPSRKPICKISVQLYYLLDIK